MFNKGNRFKQGKFTPKNPDKYVGDVDKIRYMSSWELHFDKFLDSNPNVLQWSSEEIAVPYIKPTDGRVHRYFPDYWVQFKDVDGNLKQEIYEVKPKQQTRRTRSKNPKTKIYEDITYAINIAKWKACADFCTKYGMTFRIVTEEQIFK